MPAVRITRALKDQIYFVTFTIKNLYYLFDRHNRFEILEDSFVYCQKNRNLRIYAFVFMLNHLHFIASAPDLGAVIRDMKTFLSKEFKKNILATEPSVLKIFKENGKYNFWMNTNYPKLIESEDFFCQKLDYIHYNPVKKGYVHNPENWRWSSASKIPTKIEISHIDDFQSSLEAGARYGGQTDPVSLAKTKKLANPKNLLEQSARLLQHEN